MAVSISDYKVVKCSFSLSSDLAPNTNYTINPRIGCQIKRKADRISVTFEVEIKKGVNPVPFELLLVGEGVFVFDKDSDGEHLPLLCAETLFPFVRASVASLTQIANVPPYLLPLINLSELIKNAAAKNSDVN